MKRRGGVGWTATTEAGFALAFALGILAVGIRIGWVLHALYGG